MCAQYQQLRDALEPVGPFQVVAEWEWGEKQVLQLVLAKGLLEPTWDFVPVGNRLRFDLTFVLERAMKWKLVDWDAPRLKYFWYTKPLLDLQPVLVLMNHGQFQGSSLEAFADKGKGSEVPLLYRQGRFPEILAYVTREKEAALEVIRESLGVLGDLGDRRRRV